MGPCLAEGGASRPSDASPETDSYHGLTQGEAKRYASEHDQTTRVAGRDGQCYPLTMDYRANRVNIYLENGVVVAAQVG